MLSKEECQGMQHCTLEQCIDSMCMLTMALFGSRLQGQECKRKTASLAYSRDCWYTSAELVHSILDLHCAQSILAYRQHIFDLFLPPPPKPTFDLFLAYFNVFGVSGPLGGLLFLKSRGYKASIRRSPFEESSLMTLTISRTLSWRQGESSLPKCRGA